MQLAYENKTATYTYDNLRNCVGVEHSKSKIRECLDVKYSHSFLP